MNDLSTVLFCYHVDSRKIQVQVKCRDDVTTNDLYIMDKVNYYHMSQLLLSDGEVLCRFITLSMPLASSGCLIIMKGVVGTIFLC